MLWFKGKKNKRLTNPADKKPSIEELRAEAIANARAAREHLGDETINKIAEIMKKKEESEALKRAKANIQSHSIDDLTRELRLLISD